MTTCGRPQCPNPITDSSPSPYFCGIGCQTRWQADQADPIKWGTGLLPKDPDALKASILKRIAELGGAA